MYLFPSAEYQNNYRYCVGVGGQSNKITRNLRTKVKPWSAIKITIIYLFIYVASVDLSYWSLYFIIKPLLSLPEKKK